VDKQTKIKQSIAIHHLILLKKKIEDEILPFKEEKTYNYID